MPQKLKVQTFALGEWMTNCYVVHGDKAAPGAPCTIIDAGFEPEPLVNYIRGQKLEPRRVVLTHAHLDHIAGLEVLRAVWPDLPILVHRAEGEFLGDPALNLSVALDEPVVAPAPSELLEGGQRLEVAGGLELEVRHTPGHSPGGIALYQPQEGIVFVGDVLFAGSVGRTDFPTADAQTLLQSIRGQLLSLPDTTRVYPGHGPSTTIGQERQANPFL